MTALSRGPLGPYGVVAFGAMAASLLLVPGMRNKLFASDFLPHATCYLQNPQMIWLHASSDAVIGLSYLAISSTLAFMVHRARKDIPFHWMFLAFGVFIIACGFTHLIEVWTVWKPVYWLAGYVKLITAAASIGTAIVLPMVVPKVHDLIRAAELSDQRKQRLETANRELEALYRRIKDVGDLRSQFFADVSHELRTPLTLIVSPVRELQRDANLTASQRDKLAVIERSGQLLLKHVNELLDAAKLEAGKMQLAYSRENLATMFRSLLANFQGAAQSRRIELRTEIPEVVQAEIDTGKIQRVILNLLSNALKFTPDGGVIRCEAAEREGKVRLSVADSGPGIPAEKRVEVFERFRQLEGSTSRKHSGTGLGLSISKEFVEMHGGKIWVEPGEGGGSRFVVELPARAREGEVLERAPAPEETPVDAGLYVPLAAPMAPAAAPADESRPVILLAEDNPDLSRFMTEALSRDYHVLSAENGRKALDLFEKSAPPDVVISDAMMPEMNGDVLLKEIRNLPEGREVPFIFLTGRADDDFKVRVLRAGAQDYLSKPFSLEELRARLGNIVAMSRSRRLLQQAVRGGSSDIVELVEQALRQKHEMEEANRAAEQARTELRNLNNDLESMVEKRTAELAEANEELRAFSSSVSHDLRAPLRTMRGMAEILLEIVGEKGDEEARNYADRIMLGALKMDALLNDLLTYSRLGRGDLHLGPVNLEEIVTHALSELSADIAESKAIVTSEGSLPTVKGNPTLLKQIVSNLLSNAVKYVPKDRVARVRIYCEQKGEMARIWVEDNGLGIAPENQKMIFEPFKRLHRESEYPGSGLGLAIVLKAARRMGGDVGVESTVGAGSRFWVDIQRS